MSFQSQLEQLHKKIVSNSWLKLFTAIARGLLAAGFIFPGLTKMGNSPFTQTPPSEPIGYFFDAFFQATEYYIFVGSAQVLAGIFLLFPATTALGSAIYFPVILNIFFITVALQFKGTWLITGLMLLANTYLLCWEFDKWQSFIPGFNASTKNFPNKHLGFIPTILASGITGIIGLGFFFTTASIIRQEPFLFPTIMTACALLAGSFLLYKYQQKNAEYQNLDLRD